VLQVILFFLRFGLNAVILGKWLWVIQTIEIADLAALTMFQEYAD
jgi:hypothetical protein